jgi:hypothetical protein
MGSPTEFWRLETSDFRVSGKESGLSDILEDGIDQQLHFLGPKTAVQMLGQSERLSKRLPGVVKITYRQVISQSE